MICLQIFFVVTMITLRIDFFIIAFIFFYKIVVDTIIKLNKVRILRKIVLFGVQFFTDLQSLIALCYYLIPICIKLQNKEQIILTETDTYVIYLSVMSVLATYVLELLYLENTNKLVAFHHGIVIYIYLSFSLINTYLPTKNEFEVQFIILMCMILFIHASLDATMHLAMSMYHYKKFTHIRNTTFELIMNSLFLFNAFVIPICRFGVNSLLINAIRNFFNYKLIDFHSDNGNWLFYWLINNIVFATLLFIIQFWTSNIHFKLYKKNTEKKLTMV
jgi:hypothetical protein